MADALLVRDGKLVVRSSALVVIPDGSTADDCECCDDGCTPNDCSLFPSTLNFSVESDCPFYDGWTGTATQDGTNDCFYTTTAGEQGGTCAGDPDYLQFDLRFNTECVEESTLGVLNDCEIDFPDQPGTGVYLPTAISVSPLEATFTFQFVYRANGGSCECCTVDQTFTFTITFYE